MLPANLLANFLTPVLKNWWAERSVASARKRVQKLEAELATIEKDHPETNQGLAAILTAVEGLSIVAYLSSVAILFALFTIVTADSLKVSKGLVIMNMILYVITLIMLLLMIYAIEKVTSFGKKISPRYRKSLRESIESLKKRLG